MNGTAAQVSRCLYCGAIGPWWECRCAWAEEVREGKRQAPKIRVVGGRTIIEVDAETARRNVLGFARPKPVMPVMPDVMLPVMPGDAGITDSTPRNAPRNDPAPGMPPTITESEDERLRRLNRERVARYRAKE